MPSSNNGLENDSESEIMIEMESDRRLSNLTPMPSIKTEKCGCYTTVLLADDNPFNLMPLRVILEEKYSIYCDLVENGKEELDAYIQNY